MLIMYTFLNVSIVNAVLAKQNNISVVISILNHITAEREYE